MNPFHLHAPYEPKGDQPTAIEAMVHGLDAGERYQTLLGATGTGKTFSIANVIARTGRPTLVLAHNKTLAAQLCNELREFFPNNAVVAFMASVFPRNISRQPCGSRWEIGWICARLCGN